MPYVDPDTIAVINPGDPVPAAWFQVVRQDLEFLVDPPACSVFHSDDLTAVADATNTVLPADSENFDNDGMHDSVTNNSRITLQTAGRYLVLANVTYAPDATGYRRLTFLINGTTGFRSHQGAATPGAGNETRVTATREFAFAAGDFVEVEVAQSSGGPLNCGLREFAATFLTR